MKSYLFHVLGTPKGQPRPRAFARKVGNKFVARVYEAGTAECWKSQIAIAARDAGLQNAMLEGAIKLRLTCYFQRPKSHYRTGGNSHLLKNDAPGVSHISKPDCDNLVKAVKDTLTQVGAWKDDSQVAEEIVRKKWVHDTSESTIEISFLED